MAQKHANSGFLNLAVVIFLVFQGGLLWAQSDSSMASPNSEAGSLVAPVGGNRTGPKKLSIQFDNELVKGENAVPEIETVFTQQQFNFKKMIKLREHFIPEVIKGKEEFGASE